MIDGLLRIVDAIHTVFTYGILWLVRNWSNVYSNNTTCLVGKTAIVTGGNAGIGLATSMLLASRGCKVIIANRSDASKAKDEIIKKTGNSNIITKKLDLQSFKSIRAFAKDIIKTEKKIDILINNAAISHDTKGNTEDNLDPVLQTNVIGPFLLTHLLLDPLKAAGNARIVFVASGTAMFNNIKKESFGKAPKKETFLHHFESYANSKACDVIMGQEFAKALKKYNIIVNSSDVGVAKTEMFEGTKNLDFLGAKISRMILGLFSKDTINAAQTTFHLAASNALAGSGDLYFQCKPFPKKAIFEDPVFCKVIWKKIEELAQLTPEEKLL